VEAGNAGHKVHGWEGLSWWDFLVDAEAPEGGGKAELCGKERGKGVPDPTIRSIPSSKCEKPPERGGGVDPLFLLEFGHLHKPVSQPPGPKTGGGREIRAEGLHGCPPAHGGRWGYCVVWDLH